MTTLPAALVLYRTDLEEAIAREQAARRRQSGRRRRFVLVTVAILVVGTATALAGARYLADDPWTAKGKLSRTVAGVDFSFTVPAHKRPYYQPDFGWTNGPAEGTTPGMLRIRNFLVAADIHTGQGADAVFFWTAFPEGGDAATCSSTLLEPAGRSIAELATVMARAGGTTLVRRPTRGTVGGRPAMYLVLRVRKDFGCDPGLFFTWRDQGWGPFWSRTSVGDTVRVWIVDVDGKRLVFQAESRYPGPPGAAGGLQRAYRADFKQVNRDVTNMVHSIRFD